MTSGRRTSSGARLDVPAGEVHLWALDASDGTRVPADAWAELAPAERQRAAAFVRPAGRLLYVRAHLALRRLLSAYTGIAPALLELRRDACPRCAGPHGRPVPADAPGLHFSLSHSHGLALIGVARAPVGVDVQRVPTAGTVELCLPALHPAERRELLDLRAAARPRAFAELWTRKEALLKGFGTGLGHGLGEAPYLGTRDTPDRPAGAPGWSVVGLRGCRDHAAALAVAGTGPGRAVLRELPDDTLHLPGRQAVALLGGVDPYLCMAVPAPGRPAGSDRARPDHDDRGRHGGDHGDRQVRGTAAGQGGSPPGP
ncbi:4'-phosphopantetheinyl transferase family protein [Streptomyces bacillaris]|uniref:4'-phosphopantetheinyl transferase family protein n=1 Tax=Streptomyces bacillaris TaxID=68179 RepID=UPI00380EB04C